MNIQENIQRPKLSILHPNPRGTGCAMTLELVPANGAKKGYILLEMANQMIIDGKTPATAVFDWEHSLSAKLSFFELSMFLQVFRGECERINEGKGIYFRSETLSEVVQLEHLIETAMCYRLKLHSTYDSGEEREAKICLNYSEALGVCEAITSSLALVSFGLPVAQNVDNYEEVRGNACDFEDAFAILRRAFENRPSDGCMRIIIDVDDGAIAKKN